MLLSLRESGGMMWYSRERPFCSSGRKNMWIVGVGNGINRVAQSFRSSNNGGWHKPGMKVA
jgi:hypothetical protein